MQIIELYIKGYKRINGSVSSLATNKLIDNAAQFSIFADVGDIITNQSTGLSAKITAIDSDTQVTLNYDLFTVTPLPQYLLTSDYFRADLFKDESVTITDSILNVRDIGKIFTPFSQQFNLPASKNNNKLFRHYENQDVQNSFDARYRHDAIIKLNGIDYKKGKIQFKSVDLKDNAPYAYKIVFFGDTVELKEVLGETKLSGLIYPSSLNFEYTYANIATKFQANPATNDIIVPNIHHTKNMRLNEEGLYQDYETGDYLRWTDVKPAIKCSAVIEAINNTYPQLNITGFLNSTAFKPLFMWMHKNEGYISNSIEGGDAQIVRNRFRHQDDVPIGWEIDPNAFYNVDIRTVQLTPASSRVLFQLTVQAAVQNQEYTVRFLRGGTNEVLYSLDQIGSSTNNYYITNANYGNGEIDITVEIIAESTIGLIQSLYVANQRPDGDFYFPGYITTQAGSYLPVSGEESPANTFIVAEQMPDMKVIDWLSGLFKMFNLVVYKDENEDIITAKAPSWSNLGDAYDITKYVDMSKSTVERLFQYKEMEFRFKSKKSFLVQFSDEIQGVPFSEETYPPNGISQFDGGVYKVEVPFEKMMYERITNNSTGNLSYIQQGAMLNKKFEPTIGAPLLFIPELQANTNSELQMIDISYTFNPLTPAFYNKPSQLFPLPAAPANQTRASLNFGIEADEWTGASENTTNLFSDGYLDYTEAVFNINSRLLKVSAYLPLSIITKYQMNDTFIINNKPYRINSIKTNLLTNKTDLELYNKREYVSQIENFEAAFLGRLAQVTTTPTSSTIIVGWTPLPNPVANNIVGYSLYVNGNKTNDFGADISGTTLFPLPSKTSYSIEVKVRYEQNLVIRYSFGVGQTTTTL
tara:strand:+ start:298 stop:2895 length:2598 start_codon:yes stop_codon:yes gene_type:complete